MAFSMRGFLAVAVGAGLVFGADAGAQTSGSFPSRPIRFVVPFPAGGPVDLTARLLAQHLRASLNETVLVDNRAGAATIIGTEIVARSSPDGHTWLISSNGIAINPGIYRKLPYDTFKDLAPVTLILRTPYVLGVNPALPARSMTELVQLAKSQPTKLLYSSSGIGSGNHLSAVLLNVQSGIETTHVPYKGSAPSLAAAVSGEVNFQFGNPSQSMPLAKAGKLRVLGITTARRLATLPDLPTLAESGVPGYESVTWFGLFTAAGTPGAVVNSIQGHIARALAVAEVRQPLVADGAEIVGSRPDEFARFVESEITKWGKIVQQAGVTAE